MTNTNSDLTSKRHWAKRTKCSNVLTHVSAAESLKLKVGSTRASVASFQSLEGTLLFKSSVNSNQLELLINLFWTGHTGEHNF